MSEMTGAAVILAAAVAETIAKRIVRKQRREGGRARKKERCAAWRSWQIN